MRVLISIMFAATITMPAHAELIKIEEQIDFVEIVSGKTLTLPFIKINVSPNGKIEGRGARWDVEGTWFWKEGYFCRDLFWGGDPLGYNCQEVAANGKRIQFTSDRGAGRSATFRLR